LPDVFVDTRVRRLSTTVLGEEVSLPLWLSPAGFQRMVHREAELAMARAAGASGVGFALSTGTSYRLEDVAASATGPKWFQLYMPEPRSVAEKLIGRARDAGFTALCLTVDTPMLGMRDRDVRNRLTQPLRLSPGMVIAVLRRPFWTLDFLRGGVGRVDGPSERFPISVKEAGVMLSKLGRVVTHEDLDWIRAAWPGPLVVKGILRGDVCRALIDRGVDGFVVSNHGGRQLDYSPATIDVLPGGPRYSSTGGSVAGPM
jgi:isopentenyl diphosphate isomerase/L-lactate dehydrogenase-like FMN-dependent dehydrogenase